MTVAVNLTTLVYEGKRWPADWKPVLDDHGEWNGAFDHAKNEHDEDGYIDCGAGDYGSKLASFIADAVNVGDGDRTRLMAAMDARAMKIDLDDLDGHIVASSALACR